jgi:hypothetical protein
MRRRFVLMDGTPGAAGGGDPTPPAPGATPPAGATPPSALAPPPAPPAEFIPEKPIKVPLGSKLRLICEFDNSASNPNNPDNSKEVRFGQTFDRAEMCKMNFGFTYADE